MTEPTGSPAVRSCFVLRGSRETTLSEARRWVARLAPAAVLVVGAEVDGLSPGALGGLLGRAFDAVIIDAHGELDPDVLGRCHGFVRGGGALILCLPDGPAPPGARLAAWPHDASEVGDRFWRRFERVLARHGTAPPRMLDPCRHEERGTPEQAGLVARLVAALAPDRAPVCAVIAADRGRGKSAALGLALARWVASGGEPRRAVLVALHEASLGEVRRFAPAEIAVLAPRDLIDAAPSAFDLVAIDEAAQVPVPMLRRIVRHHPRANLWFSTTVRGYEGTGRGFALRFLPWLRGERRPLLELTLTAPIRWAAGCPLERLIFDALLLDAELGDVAAVDPNDAMTAEVIDRDRLAGDEAELRALFGLLVHAHYRTTPSDLQRLLDAPNIAVHALRHARSGAIVAACLVAREGGLPRETCEALARGQGRIRAHALADALVTHLGRPDAGRLTMVRSVRIAVHPTLRRAGLASRLVAHVHASYAPDLFGTIFGATAELIAFRRSLGYEVVRVGASRGARTGEPSVMMLHARSAAASSLMGELRAELARDLDRQLELLAADGDAWLEPALTAALRAGLPPPAPLAPSARDALVAAYAHGPRTMESVVGALTDYVLAHPERLQRLAPEGRTLIEGRLLARRGWDELARTVGLAHAGLAMRAFRRHVRALL